MKGRPAAARPRGARKTKAPAPPRARRAAAAPAEAEDPSAGALPGNLRVRVTHPDKVYWPEEGFTKLDLLVYYAAVFDRLGPYVRDRLLSLERCPDGMKGQCFFQKEAPGGLPAGTPTQPIQHVKGITNYVVGGRVETQLALANLGCIAVHVWGSRRASPRKPDWICFDLDPDTGKISDAVAAALRVRTALEALELESFVKTSGGKGLHVFVPIKAGPDSDEILDFAQRLGERLASAYPKELTMEGRIANRKGRVYLDPFRNGFGQTVVAPYSVRRRPGAPYSAPLDWSDVKPGLAATQFTLGNYAAMLRRRDPWAAFWKSRQSVTRALSAVRKL